MTQNIEIGQERNAIARYKHECRIHKCMLNVRKTNLSHKYQVAPMVQKFWLLAVKYPYSNPFAQTILFCASLLWLET